MSSLLEKFRQGLNDLIFYQAKILFLRLKILLYDFKPEKRCFKMNGSCIIKARIQAESFLENSPYCTIAEEQLQSVLSRLVPFGSSTDRLSGCPKLKVSNNEYFKANYGVS